MYPAKGLFKGTTPEAAATLQPHAFSGIHLLTPAALQLLRPWPEAFSIIDFYLSIAASHPVRCVDAPAGAVITDVGKLARRCRHHRHRQACAAPLSLFRCRLQLTLMVRAGEILAMNSEGMIIIISMSTNAAISTAMICRGLSSTGTKFTK